MNDAVVIPADTPVGAEMARAAKTKRLIIFAGLPGVGKSLFLQQQALMAAQAGRQIHLLQWDIARAPFESAEMLAKYPETDGFTHPFIRKATGLWARGAVRRWHDAHPADEHLVIGEVPLSGNRFIELVQKQDDEAEELLGGEGAVFFVPVPSSQVRARIEEMRQASIANPKHEHESRDAPINVLQQLWQDARAAAIELDLVGEVGAAAGAAYDPGVYGRLFEHLLQHRNYSILTVDTLYPAQGSVYDLTVPTRDITASPTDTAAALAELEASPDRSMIGQSVEHWYRV